MNPDHNLRLLLLRAGDVERNPGPATRACSTCSTTVRANSSPLVCSRVCGRVCHKQESCSGLTRAMQAIGTWVCHASCDGTPAPGVDQQHVMLPTPVANTGPTRVCPACLGKIPNSLAPLTCRLCNRTFHHKCSGLTRAATQAQNASNAWSCVLCCPDHQQRVQPSGDTVDKKPSRVSQRRKLRILQWNVDGIGTAMPDIEQVLQTNSVDIAMIQETKLRSFDRTPQLNGYTTVRRDRPSGGRGGGLIAFIKKEVPFNEVCAYRSGVQPGSLEALAVEVRLGAGVKHIVANVYAPPVRSQIDGSAVLDLSPLAVSDRHIYCGDWNAHSLLWDSNSPEDQAGEILEAWMEERRLSCCNDGSMTHVNRGTGNESCPDLTVISSSLLQLAEWKVLSRLGSDHFPILCEISLHCEVSLDLAKAHLRWAWNKADWSSFSQFVDQAVHKVSTKKWTLSRRVKFLTDTMEQAAVRFIGKERPKKRGQIWMTEDIRKAINARNVLGRDLASNRVAWQDACKNVSELVISTKRLRWQQYVESLGANSQSSKTWSVIRSLSGKAPSMLDSNRALVHNGREFRTSRDKANTFCKFYASVSRHKLSADDRTSSCTVKQRLTFQGRCCGPVCENSSDFTGAELCIALKQSKAKAAAGPDGVSVRFMQRLGRLGKIFLLSCFNQSWQSGLCPQAWRSGIIVPILKPGKAADAVGSYRPICLTSCMAKVMERMVGNRLTHLAESQGMWCQEQAGFRGLRSTEDQILRISQAIDDGFQQRPPLRTVMALLDYTKAYDTVWRSDLWAVLLDAGVPFTYIQWIKGFLTNRLVKVRYSNIEGNSVLLREGLPQGSVLSPLLFLFVINGARQCCPPGINISLYADDIAIWSSSPIIAVASDKVERAVTCIKAWSSSKKLSLNLAKCEVTLFSSDTKEADIQPLVRVDGTPLKFNANPVFLGVMYDRMLTFNAQAKRVASKVSSGARMLGALAGATWGWDKPQLTRIYQAAVAPIVKYACAGWSPWLSITSVAAIERSQNRCLRRVTGQYATTRIEVLRCETGIPSLKTVFSQEVLISMERSIRVQEGNPRGLLPVENVRHRTKRNSWRKEAVRLRHAAGLDALPVEKFPPVTAAPWLFGLQNLCIQTSLWDASNCRSSSAQRLSASLETIRRLGRFDTTIFTDGSAEGGIQRGGSAAVVFQGEIDTLQQITTRLACGSAWTSSFETEARAMRLACEYLTNDCAPGKYLICTDSQSLLKTLESGMSECRTSIGDLCRAIKRVPGRLTLQWVPGHCGLLGNEIADRAAREAACSLDDPSAVEPAPISFSGAKTAIRFHFKEPPPQTPQVRAVYCHGPLAKPTHDRKTEVTLARLRSGHSTLLAAYQHMVGRSDSPICPRCEVGAETLSHFMQDCPSTIRARIECFGTHVPHLSCLSTEPKAAASYLRRLCLL